MKCCNWSCPDSPGRAAIGRRLLRPPDPGNLLREAMERPVPMKRAAHPEKAAERVEFLGSDRASYITGRIISIDGGMIRN